MNWFSLTIVNLLLMTAAGLINKRTIDHDGVDEVIYGAGTQLVGSVVAFILALLTTGFSYSFNSTSVPLFGLMTAGYCTAVSLYFTGLKHVELSVSAIIESLGAIFSLVLGLLFLGEAVTLFKVIGVVLVMGAVIFVAIKYREKKSSVGKYALYIIVAIFFYASSAVFDKKLLAFGTPLTYLSLSYMSAGTAMLVVYGKRTIAAVKGSFRNKQFLIGSFSTGTIYAFAFWALFEAYSRGGEVSRMFPMQLSVSVLIPLLSIVLLKERDHMAAKLIALPIMVTGLWFLGS